MKERLSNLRWLMISLVFLATAINYLDRQTLSVVAPILIDQFRMSNETYSHIIFAFMLAYTIMNAASGPIIDRLGTRVGYALTTAWWSLAAMVHALAQGPWSLAAYRFLLGMGEAGNWPAGVKVVAEWFPARERALASGIFNSGSSFGAIVAPPIVVWIVLKSGWREAFVAVGSVGLIWVLLWLLVYRTPAQAKEAKEARKKEERAPAVPLRALFRTRFVWSFTLAKAFIDPVWYFYIFWFPEYLKRARHFDLASIGKYAWVPFLVAGLGNLLGGWFVAILLRHNVPVTRARKSATTIFGVLMLAAIPAVLTPSAAVSIAFVSVAILGYTGVSANMLAFPADVFPKTVVASIWGLASTGSGFGGMVFALATGWVVDHYSYVPVFIGFGLIPLIALAIVWFVLGPLDPLPQFAENPSEAT
jgi:MFS transporter, ACS family, aldohexuronate transporter